jgi:hypothetical protein
MRCSELAGSASPRPACAELYADTPGELEHVLRFVPPHRHLPMVH